MTPVIVAGLFVAYSLLTRITVWIDHGYWPQKTLFYEFGIVVEPTDKIGLNKIIEFIANLPIEVAVVAAAALYLYILFSYLEN